MIKVLAPKSLRGCSWAFLSVLLMGALTTAVAAQPATPKGAEPTKSGTAKGADPARNAAAGDESAKPDEADGNASATLERPETLDETAPEIFNDPNAAKALTARSPSMSGGDLNPRQITQLRGMASGQSNVDQDLIKKYVNGMAADLCNQNYIRAVADPKSGVLPTSRAARAVREATANLLDPMEIARKAQNESFLTAYHRELLTTLPKLLDGHLITRVEAMMALAFTGSPDALDVFVKQIASKSQTVWVKLLAARGITNIVQSPAGNRADILVGKSDAAAKALAAFLTEEKGTPWPVQVRVLEALGALRVAAVTTEQSKAKIAEAPMSVLADTHARLESRAWASWALGMLQIGPQISRFNFPLVAYYVGDTAAEIGKKVAESVDDNHLRAEFYAGLLVYQIYPTFQGQNDYRESGLLKAPGLGAARSFVTSVSDQVKKVTQASVELIRATPGQRPALIKELNDRINALRSVLEKNPPTERTLVPGGLAFPVGDRVAGVARPGGP